MSHYEHLYMNKETLDSSSQGGILKVIFKVATYSSFLRLIHETLIRDFNENCQVTLNEFDPCEDSNSRALDSKVNTTDALSRN